MILISDDVHDYVLKKGGGRVLRLDRRRISRRTVEQTPDSTKSENELDHVPLLDDAKRQQPSKIAEA